MAYGAYLQHRGDQGVRTPFQLARLRISFHSSKNIYRDRAFVFTGINLEVKHARPAGVDFLLANYFAGAVLHCDRIRLVFPRHLTFRTSNVA
jgi:hypothetical protein